MPERTLPDDAAERVANRLNALAPDLFRALDETREFGGTCLAVRMAHPDTGEIMHLLLAPASFQVAFCENESSSSVKAG